MFGLGSLVENVCDRLGLPEQLGDLASLGVDAYTGNWLACAMDAQDLLEDAPGGGDGGGGHGLVDHLLAELAGDRYHAHTRWHQPEPTAAPVVVESRAAEPELELE